ncbi:EamA family transporter [Altererythrobacter arenosus]|uniref:EamA family transporter n=1 Tax=Altererythrobacter arenosus TaxID=3032592 RepID=A0ABY8FTY9_9SPHN|nr:EamA family transporter [Altererythrobacter sp. CAU 1644]WFL78476.1 EamA family transporter [Altererythrobacter sp. CAU 1644]
MIDIRMTKAQWAMLVLLSMLWGGSFFFVEAILVDLPPLTLVLGRVTIAATCLWVFLLVTRRPLALQPRIWLAFAIMGLLNNLIPFSLIAWGQTEISSGLASILNATTPLFAVLVAALWLPDERPGPAKITGVAIGFVGVVVLIGSDALGGLGASTMAQAAILLAAISYAFAGAFGRRFRDYGVDPVMVAAGQLSASAVFLAPVAILIDRPGQMAMPGIAAMLALLGLALFSTALAYVLYFRLLAQAGATNLLLVTFLIPVSAIALGTTFLAEQLSPNEITGMAIIALGLVVLDGRAWEATKRGTA